MATVQEEFSALAPVLRFGRVELRSRERLVLVDGQPVPLGARAFDVLIALVERRDRVVAKAELLDLAWPGLMVEENNLSVQISALRKVLGPQAVATIPALGYRFALAEDKPPAAASIATEALARQQGALQLRARIGWPGGAASTTPASALRLAQALASTVAQHGGRLIHRADDQLVAEFARAEAAAACSHRLHEAAQALAAALQISLLPADAAALPAQLPAIAAEAHPGQTLVAASVAGRLIHTLDGDLQDLGDQHAATPDEPNRFFRLMPLVASMPVEERLSPSPSNLRPTLAVMPFAPYARQSEPISLGDILADQVIAALSKSPAFNVISRLSTLAFRGRDTPVPQIARCLAANFVVSGRYWVVAGRINLQVELADAASSQVLWTQSLADDELAVLQPDSPLVLALVGGVVQAVFAHEMAGLRGAALPDLASHTLLLAAISLLYRLSPRDFSLARSALETLHQRAPRHAAPLAWLARWHLFRVVQGWSDNRDEDGRLALDHANQALDLDPDSSLALTMLGNVHTSYLKDLDRAEWLYDQALAINPNESLAWLQKGNARSFRGDGATAVACAQRAVNLSPLDPSSHFYLTILAGAALTAQDYPRAIAAASASAKLNQMHLSTHRVLAIALAMSGRMAEARASVRQVLHLGPGLTVANYLAHSPAAGSALVRTFGDALHAAGLPLG